MSDVYAGIDGHRATAVRVSVGSVGPWVADVDLEDDTELAGERVTVRVGALELVGTVEARSSGTHGVQRRVRVVAGGGGWSSSVAAKHYHNDAGIKARTIADDAAREVGETIASFVPASERVWRDYARQAGAASRALEDAIGTAAWWVDYAGATHVGTRPSAAVDASAYEVLAYDPRDRIATLAVDDPGAVRIGAVLSEGLDEPATVRSLDLRVTAGELRLRAHLGAAATGHSYLAGLLRSIAQRALDGRLYGHYRYRVVRMAGARAELQAVRAAPGLPDMLPISIMPGVAGAHAQLAPGAEVLVAFVEGDRGMPVVVAHSGLDGPAFTPVRLTLGGEEGPPAARQGDAVRVLCPPASIVGTLNGVTPLTGVITFPSLALDGVITAGSGKVRLA